MEREFSGKFESEEQKTQFERIRSACLSLPATSERLSHGAPAFFVQEKRSFVMYQNNHHGDGRLALWCAAPAGMQSLLLESSPDIYFRPPYVGHHGWIGVRLDRSPTWKQLLAVIGDAYLTKAPEKIKKTLDRTNVLVYNGDE